MNTMKTIVLGILATIAIIGAFAEPAIEESWMTILLLTKGIAFASGYACYRLFKRWQVKW